MEQTIPKLLEYGILGAFCIILCVAFFYVLKRLLSSYESTITQVGQTNVKQAEILSEVAKTLERIALNTASMKSEIIQEIRKK